MSALHQALAEPGAVDDDTASTDPAGANYAYGSNAVSWEPLITDALAGDLVPALVDTAAEASARSRSTASRTRPW